jgi:hypothetical protein
MEVLREGIAHAVGVCAQRDPLITERMVRKAEGMPHVKSGWIKQAKKEGGTRTSIESLRNT